MSDTDFARFFALQALTTALKARTSHLQFADKLNLTMAVIQWPDHDNDVRLAVFNFIELAKSNPQQAGAALHDFVSERYPDVSTARAGQVLAELQTEFDLQQEGDRA